MANNKIVLMQRFPNLYSNVVVCSRPLFKDPYGLLIMRVIYHMIIDKIIKKKCEIEPRDTFKDILKFSINLSRYKKKKKKDYN